MADRPVRRRMWKPRGRRLWFPGWRPRLTPPGEWRRPKRKRSGEGSADG